MDADPGVSIMEAAVQNSVEGIDADCGGACACATCHVFISEPWKALLDPQGDVESSMLEFAEGAQETSRLACQIKLHDNLDGILVTIPEAQF